MSQLYSHRARTPRVEPKGIMKQRIWSGDFTLEELFLENRADETLLNRLKMVARLKVINVFRMSILINQEEKYSDPDTIYTKAKSFKCGLISVQMKSKRHSAARSIPIIISLASKMMSMRLLATCSSE